MLNTLTYNQWGVERTVCLRCIIFDSFSEIADFFGLLRLRVQNPLRTKRLDFLSAMSRFEDLPPGLNAVVLASIRESLRTLPVPTTL